MTQSERDEEAQAVLEYEAMRAQGVSLQEIGAGRFKIEKTEEGNIEVHRNEDVDSGEEKISPNPKHIEQA